MNNYIIWNGTSRIRNTAEKKDLDDNWVQKIIVDWKLQLG